MLRLAKRRKPEIIILERQSRSIVATFQTPKVSLEFIVSDKE
jgi:hypothetical protein